MSEEESQELWDEYKRREARVYAYDFNRLSDAQKLEHVLHLQAALNEREWVINKQREVMATTDRPSKPRLQAGLSRDDKVAVNLEINRAAFDELVNREYQGHRPGDLVSIAILQFFGLQ